MPLSIREIEEGTTITFRSKNPNDTTVWRGTLEAVGTYRSIRAYLNPLAYNAAVRQLDPSVPADIMELTYFLITVDNDATEPTMQAFAEEWIASGSLAEINLGKKITIRVDDPMDNPQRLMSLLSSAGYSFRVIGS